MTIIHTYLPRVYPFSYVCLFCRRILFDWSAGHAGSGFDYLYDNIKHWSHGSSERVSISRLKINAVYKNKQTLSHMTSAKRNLRVPDSADLLSLT